LTIKEALEILRKEYRCRTMSCPDSVPIDSCDGCDFNTDNDNFTEALKTILDAFGNCSELPNSSRDLIDRAEAQTELQFAARRYTVSCEAYGEGQVVWSENLISVTDAMNALRKVPSVHVKQKKGRWIPIDDPSITGRCSVCGFESHLCEDDVYGYDYCPNCGARLEVVDE